jgi:hypothetical protein
MTELGDSLQRMDYPGLLLLFGFVMSYVLAISRLMGGRARGLAALSSVGLALAFSMLTTPWEHGVLLIVSAIAAVGTFSALVWLLGLVLEPRDEPSLEGEPAQRHATRLRETPPAQAVARATR